MSKSKEIENVKEIEEKEEGELGLGGLSFNLSLSNEERKEREKVILLEFSKPYLLLQLITFSLLKLDLCFQ